MLEAVLKTLAALSSKVESNLVYSKSPEPPSTPSSSKAADAVRNLGKDNPEDMNYVAEVLAALAALETTGSGVINTPAESKSFTIFGQDITASVPSVPISLKKS